MEATGYRRSRGGWLVMALVAAVLPILLGAILGGGQGAWAGDPALSDPDRVAPPPDYAIGFPSRAAGLDVLPGFRSPPPGYGEVGFYWWLGDPLTRERLAWQIEQLAGKGVMGLQVNYAHSTRGGRSYGLTYPSDPPLFSEAWWRLYGWFVQQAKRHGMAASLSDYTLGFGQGWYVDEILRENPSLCGATLTLATRDVAGGGPIEWETPAGVVGLSAHRLQGDAVEPAPGINLRAHLRGRTLRWTAPAGRWRLLAVHSVTNPWSIDPLHPRTGPELIAHFFQRFEDRNPGEAGRGLNFFFSDELSFGVAGNLWTPRFAEEFAKRKGYDLRPELAALFVDVGPRTPKVRLDYRDVMVSLGEESVFRPLFDWHQRRGMIFGCDHGGRGRDVVEFGDYFRTQRWNQGPGCDQPGLASDLIKNKVASSITHLYQRPRTWLEGYYGSGWGTTSAQVADATLRNFAMGQNLLTLHGLYYSTHGGWWEWAPPCNHFHMPYWRHMGTLLACTQRLSYVLSQGVHRCDVAVLYPVAPVEAGLGGSEAVAAAFSAAEWLYRNGIDFDFIDFESLARAEVRDASLCVSGETYRVLVLPAMRAVRHSTLDKAEQFFRGGGAVVALKALPEASDRVGRDDPQLHAAVREIFGVSADTTARAEKTSVRRSDAGGLGLLVDDIAAAQPELDKRSSRDFRADAPAGAAASPYFMHRRIGPREVYFVYGLPQGTMCEFRAVGQVELWDPWTGQTHPLGVVAQTDRTTRLRLPRAEKSPQLIVFSPGKAQREQNAANAAADATAASTSRALDGPWEFELLPTLDNRFGDYRWPPFSGCIGAEARRFRYAEEPASPPGAIAPWHEPGLDDSSWRRVTYGYGTQFWRLGPLAADVDVAALEARLAACASLDPAEPVTLAGKRYNWQPHDFSWRMGVEGDPGFQGYHGLKSHISDAFVALGAIKDMGQGMPDRPRVAEPGGTRYYLWTTVRAPRDAAARLSVGGLAPSSMWLDGRRREPASGAVRLRAGANPILLRYDNAGRGWVVFRAEAAGADGDSDDPAREVAFSPAARWIWAPKDGGLDGEWSLRREFNLALAATTKRAVLRITCDDGYTAWLNGVELGRGDRWAQIDQYDVARHLRRGRNVLAVRAANHGGEAGLIAELSYTTAAGTTTRIATDAAWRVSADEPAGWRRAGFDDRPWPASREIMPFVGSLWYTHQYGPPRLGAGPEPGGAVPTWEGPLAMRWFNRADVLPFDVRPAVAAPAGWYRFTAPPGLRSMTVYARGAIRAWIDGREADVRQTAVDRLRCPDALARAYRVDLPQPAAECAKVAIRVAQDRGAYGGAALVEPIALDCGPGRFNAGDWSTNDSLAFYSGGAWYRRTIRMDAASLAGRVMLDLGDVASSAEVRVNGRSAGVLVAPPWTLDITSHLRPGENRLEVLVYNALANHYATIPTRYLGSPVSGLLGPVRLRRVAH